MCCKALVVKVQVHPSGSVAWMPLVSRVQVRKLWIGGLFQGPPPASQDTRPVVNVMLMMIQVVPAVTARYPMGCFCLTAVPADGCLVVFLLLHFPVLFCDFAVKSGRCAGLSAGCALA